MPSQVNRQQRVVRYKMHLNLFNFQMTRISPFLLISSGAALVALTLSGCTSGGPHKDSFLTAARIEAGTTQICLPLQDYTSYGLSTLSRPLPLGAETVVTGHTATLSRLERLNTLAKAGLLQSQPAQAFLEKELKPALRFSLSEEGRKLLVPTHGGDACVKIGEYTPEFIAEETDASSTTTKAPAEGRGIETRAARIRLTPRDVPEGVQALDLPEVSRLLTPKEIKVVLVKSASGEWMSRKQLMRELAKEGSSASYRALTSKELQQALEENSTEVLKGLREPAYDSQERLFSAWLSKSDVNRLPARLRTTPGLAFFADVSQPSRPPESTTAGRLKTMLEAAQSTEERIALRSALARLNESSPASPGAMTDSSLNDRLVLQQELDELVRAGAYTKQVVTSDKATQEQPGGVYYVPLPDVFSSKGLAMGGLKWDASYEIVEADASGQQLVLAIPVVRQNMPQWLSRLSASSFLKQQLGGQKGLAYVRLSGVASPDTGTGLAPRYSATRTFIVWDRSDVPGGQVPPAASPRSQTAPATSASTSSAPATQITTVSVAPKPVSEKNVISVVPGVEVKERLQGLAVCDFLDRKLPSDLKVIAASASTGQPLSFQIDQSGSEASKLDVNVHSDKPTALLLYAYNPTVWNIRWSKGTTLAAVYVTGYHRQVVAGLPSNVPLITTSFTEQSPCGADYASHASWVNPKAKQVFGRPVERLYDVAKNGVFDIDESTRNVTEFLTNSAVTVESFKLKNAPLAGKAGIEDAVRKGLLRKADAADVQALKDALNAEKSKRMGGLGEPPRASGKGPQLSNFYAHDLYVVLKPFKIPAGLYGGNSVQFLVPKGIPAPEGNPGHCMIFDLNKSTICTGPLCDMMNRE